MVIKGRNSGRNKISHNKGNFRDGVCLKPLNGFEWKSLCMMIMTYRLLMKVKLSDILQGWPFWTSYIIEQLTGSGFNADKKGSENCFKRVCWTVPYLISIILCQISLHPKDFGDFQYQCKKCKNDFFFISSIIFTAVNFKVLCCFLICCVVLSWRAMKSDSNHVFSNVRHHFWVFLH